MRLAGNEEQGAGVLERRFYVGKRTVFDWLYVCLAAVALTCGVTAGATSATNMVDVDEKYWNNDPNLPVYWRSTGSGTGAGFGGGLKASSGSKWAKNGFEISWKIALEGDHYRYEYYLSPGSEPEISHFILETSRTFTMAANFIEDGSSPLDDEIKDLPKEFEKGPSNPAMPNPIFGIKFDTDGLEVDGTVTVTLLTNRSPIWGDFYAKGGSGDAVWNKGLMTWAGDPEAEDDANNFKLWIPVPDTKTIPAPGAAVAGFAMLATLAGGRYTRRSTPASA